MLNSSILQWQSSTIDGWNVKKIQSTVGFNTRFAPSTVAFNTRLKNLLWRLTVDLKIFCWERFLVVSSKKGTTSLAITKNASNIIGGESDVVVYTFEMRLDTLEYFIL